MTIQNKAQKKNMCWNTACLPREGHGILPFLLLLQKRPHKIFLPIERDIFCIHQEKDLQCYVTFSSTYTYRDEQSLDSKQAACLHTATHTQNESMLSPSYAKANSKYEPVYFLALQ